MIISAVLFVSLPPVLVIRGADSSLSVVSQTVQLGRGSAPSAGVSSRQHKVDTAESGAATSSVELLANSVTGFCKIILTAIRLCISRTDTIKISQKYFWLVVYVYELAVY